MLQRPLERSLCTVIKASCPRTSANTATCRLVCTAIESILTYPPLHLHLTSFNALPQFQLGSAVAGADLGLGMQVQQLAEAADAIKAVLVYRHQSFLPNELCATS